MLTQKLASLLICFSALFANLSAPLTAGAATPKAAPCPAGWGHGGLANPEAHSVACTDGRAELEPYKVYENEADSLLVGQLYYQAPPNCLSDNSTYAVQVTVPQADEKYELTVQGHSGVVEIYLNVKHPPIGQNNLWVRISSGNCHAETETTFRILAATTKN